MTRQRVVHEPGFVLHTYPYKESSLIVELFTRHHGRVGLLAKGARRPRSVMRGVLLAFHPLHLSWSGSAELRTLVAADWAGGQPALSGVAVMCGFYLNELLLRLLLREDAHERLFTVYASSLAQLATQTDRATVLRGFERRLLAELGYAPLLERDAEHGAPVEPGRRYHYDPDRGPLAVNGGVDVWTVGGQTLLDIAHDEYTRASTRDEARQLLRTLIARQLGNQVLHTRAVLAGLQEL